MKNAKKQTPITPPEHQLSSRERQIMDIVYEKGDVTVAQVREAMPDAPGYSAVRAMMSVLEEKGHLRHENQGNRYVYLSVRPRGHAGQSTLQRVVDIFFGGSVEQTVATLLSSSEAQISDEELERISLLIEAAKKEGR